MRRFSISCLFSMVTLILLSAGPRDAGAQTCRGMPRRGGIGVVAGREYVGSSLGATLSKGPIAVGFNSFSGNDDITTWDANLRLTLAVGGKLQWCPSIGFDFRSSDLDISDGSKLTARTGTAAAGFSLGYEQEVSKGVSVVPFIGVDFQFSAVVFSLDTPDSEEGELSGDTLSTVNVLYGALATYKSFFAGVAMNRFADAAGRPYRARWILGYAFAGSSRSSRVTSIPTSNVREHEGRN